MELVAALVFFLLAVFFARLSDLPLPGRRTQAVQDFSIFGVFVCLVGCGCGILIGLTKLLERLLK